MRIRAGILTTLAFAATASAQPNRADFNLPAIEPDPLYHVELILFAFNEGNRFEEDFLHGIDNPRFLPAPRLLHVPAIEMERVFRSGSEIGARLPDIESVPGEQSPVEANAPATEPVIASQSGDGLISSVDELQDRLELIELDRHPESIPPAGVGSLPAAFRPLMAGELELGEVAARMDRRPYSLLAHTGWVQTGVDPDRSVALDLKHLGINNPTGSIEVSARRYLRAIVDLDFYEGSGTFWTAGNGIAIAQFQYAQSYKLEDQEDAIRSGNTMHYIDHPLFGVLIQIRRAPEPDDETGTDNAGGPAG